MFNLHESIEAIREKTTPWIPLTFCTYLSLTTLFETPNAVGNTFRSFMPLCFFHVGLSLYKLRKENIALAARLDELTSHTAVSRSVSS